MFIYLISMFKYLQMIELSPGKGFIFMKVISQRLTPSKQQLPQPAFCGVAFIMMRNSLEKV